MQTGSTKIIGLRIDPLDVLAFRDGRPFDTGSMAKCGLPMPQALAGALRTALLEKHGCNFQKFAEKFKNGASFLEAVTAAGAPEWIARTTFRGPWLARIKEDDLCVYVSAPANLQKEKEGNDFHVLNPLSDVIAPGWNPPEGECGMLPLWPNTPKRTERIKGLLSMKGLAFYLKGKPIERDHIILNENAEKERVLFGFDERTGIGIDPDSLSAEEGLIYGIGFLSLNKDVCFYAEAVLPTDEAADLFKEIGTIFLGGEGRKAVLSVINRVKWPEETPSKPEDKPLVLLTTPAFFTACWKPAVLNDKLVAAAVPGYVPISGWDLARGGPKPTRFAVSAGSVFFMKCGEQKLPEVLTDQDEDQLMGYGCYLKGVWRDE
jgi:CRISPR-associated protein Cmr3